MRFLLPFMLMSCGGYIDAPAYYYDSPWLGDVVEQFEDDVVIDGMLDEDAGAFDDEYELVEKEGEEVEVTAEAASVQQSLVIKTKFDKIEAGTFTCKYGGSVTVTRTEVPPTLLLDWAFAACSDKKDKTTDGSVYYEYDSSTITVSYDATLTYTGKDAGTCVLTSQFTGRMAEKFKKHLCKIPKAKK